jgi:aldose 1-epimerase
VIDVHSFGILPDGTRVDRWTLDRGRGMRVSVMGLGAAITGIDVPDRAGRSADVVLGFDDLAGYVAHRGCLGAVVGRVANRIRDARFTLDGRTYALATRPNGLHIHGGPAGFDKRLWAPDPFETADGSGVRFTRVSPDGEEGYPGNCRAVVTYTLTDADALVVDYQATTDAPTPVNLSQHVYVNLAGHDQGDILGHLATIHASRFTPMDEAMMPTGEIRSVDGSPLDFREEARIGARIDAGDPQLRIARGYDHNYVIDRPGPGLVPAARLRDPASGRTLEVSTTEPCVQFYTGNSLDGTLRGKGGRAYGPRAGCCFETQHAPNSPNVAAFPSIILHPGGEYLSRTVFAFGVDR